MFTFVVTLSGVTVAKIGSPFWGAVAGVTAMLITAAGQRSESEDSATS
jgi:predicted benzoate:H+ symporter BenE